LYAELLEQLATAEGHREFGSLNGSFVEKKVKGELYWYFKTSEGMAQKEFYVGRGAKADEVMDSYQAGRTGAEQQESRIQVMASMLRQGVVHAVDPASGKVIRALAAAGVFHLGGVLVGTHAYLALGNAMGVRWGSALATQDIDFATHRAVIKESELAVAIPRGIADIPKALDALEMGFLPVPGMSPRSPSTSFKVKGQELRVDLLTPGSGKPIHIPRFKTAAAALPFLDFILEDAFPAVVVNGGATFVKVPTPARFGVHKLAVADQRPLVEQAKAEKDRAQAVEILSWLMTNRPGDLDRVLEELRTKRRTAWTVRIARSARLAEGMPLELVEHLVEAAKVSKSKI
jgi:hypothetical protein